MEDKVYYTGITPRDKIEEPEDRMWIFDFPENKIEIAEIYRIRMHELLDKFIKNMSKDKLFVDEMEIKIYRITSTKPNFNIEDFFDNLYRGDEDKI